MISDGAVLRVQCYVRSAVDLGIGSGMLERYSELRSAAAGSESGGRSGMMVQVINDS